MKILTNIFIFVLVCHIFEFKGESPDGCADNITKWLQGKTLVEMKQSSTDGRTLITIIAESVNQ